nr:reverse transcriptase domain-containing protein [Tanacetum cinerariifolium]
MSTRSSTRNLFPPLDNPKLSIRRRSNVDPTLLNDFEMATDGNGDPPVPDLWTMKELCQPTLNGRGGPIASIAIQATNFGLKNDMIQQVQNSCQFHGLPDDDANKHLDKFLHVTHSIKVNGVTDDALHLYLFLYSLTHHATDWFDHLQRNSINTFEQMAKMFLGKYFPPSMVTKLRNAITNFRQRPDDSLFKAWERYKLSIDRFHNHNMLLITQIDTFYNGLTLRHRDTINAASGGTFMKRRPEECYDLIENMTTHHNDWDTLAQRSDSSSSITSSSDLEIIALKAKIAKINKNLMKVLQINQQVIAVTPSCETCCGPHSYNDFLATTIISDHQGSIKVKTEFFQGDSHGKNNHGITQGNNQGRNQFFQGASHGQNLPSAYQALGYQALVHQDSIPQPQVVTTTEFTNYMKANDAILKNMQTNMTSLTNSNLELKNMFCLFMKMNTASSSGSRTLLSNIVTNPKEDLKGITTRSGNAYQGPTIPTTSSSLPKVVERETAVTKDTLPEKLGDPGKFLIPCDFPEIDECLALDDLDVTINLMPLSVWNKLSLPKVTPTLMTLKLAEWSISRPIGVVKDVFVKVGKFHFPTDFVVVDFDADPRVPLILERSCLKTGRALIDVYTRELTRRVNNEAITFNLDQTSRFSANYNDMTANQIDVIDMACEDLTPFGDSDFLLEEVDAFLALKDDPTSPEVDHSYYDKEGDILLLEAFLNDDPSLPPPTQEIHLPQIRKELKICEAKNDKSSINEPPEVELKNLPPHLEYVFLEDDDKLPAIIAKDLSIEEKATLIKVLKLHKQAITWKLSDIKGINPEFYTHKILMEDDFKPAVQHQRRVNPKIHDVIKKEVEKLLDVGLIYLISNSPWVSPVHCVLKKGGFTVVENEENELILTRLFTGWRVCIDYHKLNEATRKDHFPLPFMDQMLERLTRNEYYCFLDGFSGYFQIPIDPKDQEKTTFTCPYGTFVYRCIPFGLCNASGMFQRCMMAIFQDMIEKTMKVFMDDISVFGNLFETCLSHLDKMLKQCEDTNLCLRWEKSHFMVKEGIVLGHKISKNGIEVDKAKVDVIAKLPHPTTVKGVPSFLGHAGFYRRFIKDFSKISRPITHLLEKNTPFIFSDNCIQAFETLKKKLTKAPILISPDWDLPFEIMCDASDFAIAAVLGKPLTFLRLAKMDPPRDTMARTTPPKSGQVEVSNRCLERILERTVGENRASWSDKLDDALWAFVQLSKHPSGVLRTVGDHRKGQLNELNELRDQAFENSLIYKEKTKRIHDSKIKDRVFNVGDRVLLFNYRLKIFLGKLKTRCSGPFTITQMFPYGKVELSQTNGENFKVNGHRLEHYFGEDIPKMVVQNLQTFPKDQ